MEIYFIYLEVLIKIGGWSNEEIMATIPKEYAPNGIVMCVAYSASKTLANFVIQIDSEGKITITAKSGGDMANSNWVRFSLIWIK